ncbi:TPA: hypothetical protein HA351_13185 [Methanosarcinaceae archaeon]|nr:hypothetical protein [Methanosarcinaceae archaeon]
MKFATVLSKIPFVSLWTCKEFPDESGAEAAFISFTMIFSSLKGTTVMSSRSSKSMISPAFSARKPLPFSRRTGSSASKLRSSIAGSMPRGLIPRIFRYFRRCSSVTRFILYPAISASQAKSSIRVIPGSAGL